MSQMMCHLPGVLMGGVLLLAAWCLYFYQTGFVMLFAALSLVMYFFCMHMGLGSLYGVYRLRKDLKKNWRLSWKEFLSKNPGIDEGMLHIVILPNYKEDEQMLSQTVSNLAESDHAGKYMVVVLAMEAREGDPGKEKAERLIARHKNQFKEMFATYHPTYIPCEVIGKSSNTQWAFREVQRWYGSHVSRTDEQHDTSKVFLTVADADSLHHKDYFTSLAISGLSMSASERSWTIWQAPILLLRNYETVPNLVRTSAYGTFLFEISGLASAGWVDHCCFSAYSLSLALANHPMVDGWDADVIAEDHHMFMKCMFASYWEDIFSNNSVNDVSKLALKPIWLPVTSYLAEDSKGWLATCYARFQQARRHSQGVAELSYAILQYLTIWSEHQMPWRCHYRILGLIHRYTSVHIWTSVHSLLGIVTAMIAAYWVMVEVFQGDLTERIAELDEGLGALDDSTAGSLLIFVAMFMPLFTGLFGLVSFLLVKDSLEGRYCPLYLQSVKDPERQNKKSQNLSIREQIILFGQIFVDFLGLGQLCVVVYGTIPLLMACVSLSRHGHKFEYIVAAKPETCVSKSNEKGMPEELEVLKGANDDFLNKNDEMELMMKA
jgi:cellulose synthase/poly-beta-1,6-N-acetylglucosamine synthase-like glycosyltransferase